MADDKADHEDAALHALRDELVARGREAEIIARPDRDQQPPGLTVDALFEIDGEKWAVDHCLLSRPAALPAAMSTADRTLRERLEQLAESSKRMIFVSYLPQTGAKGERWGANYYDQLIQLAEQALADDAEFVAGDDGFATVQIRPSDTPTAVLVPFTSTTNTASIGGQIAAGLREPLLKKLDGQLRRAKEAGYQTAVLLDQVPRPGGNSHTVWNSGPTTVAAATSAIVREHRQHNPKILDQVWLRPAQSAHPLTAPAIHLLFA